MAILLSNDEVKHFERVHLYAERMMALAGPPILGTAHVNEPSPEELEALTWAHLRVVALCCASEEGADPRFGVEAIGDERLRQLGPLGWTGDHDDRYSHEQLAAAGALLALPACERDGDLFDLWPWEDHAAPGYRARGDRDKDIPDRKRELEKAGALVAAEWDRLDRIEASHET